MIEAALPSKGTLRIQAVLALLRGEPLAQVSARYRIGRSDLYKFRRRALTAIQHALDDQPRGPKRPHNRFDPEGEAKLVGLCKRYPALSAQRMARHFGPSAPSLRTIQRIRRRHHLPRFRKRAPPLTPGRRIPADAKARAWQLIEEKPFLGPERLAWDLRNGDNIRISASTLKRLKKKGREAMKPPRLPPPIWRFYERHHPHSLWHGDFLEKITLTDSGQTAYHFALMDDYSRGYVFCDLILAPDLRTTIRALIAAMRQWQAIPKAVVFDNGSHFKGTLLSVFCERVGIRLIHSAVNHPQTNGKLERAFRDDMRDFYRQYAGWFFEPLHRDLPDYVHYRNYVRGHQALGGRPAIDRLNAPHTRAASAEVLAGLERLACHEVGRKMIPASGSIRLFNRDAYVGPAFANREV